MGVNKLSTRWLPCYRIIPSRFPPVGWFDRVTTPKDLNALYALEALTNPLVRDEVGDLRLVPDEERICGSGTQLIMTAFTHLNREGSRFSDGTFGVYYAGESQDTAIMETIHGHSRRLKEASLGPRDLEMQVILADLDGDLWDVRGPGFESYHDPDPATYAAGQVLARKAKAERADGIRYRSVRRASGECVAVLRPTALSKAHSTRHLIYPWDGVQIDPGRICVKTLLA